MKKMILLVVLMAAATAITYAQSGSRVVTISQDQYDRAIQAARDQSDGLRQRSIWTFRTYDNSVLVKTETIIIEHLPPNLSRYQTTIRMGNSVTRKDEIFFNGKGYLRINGGKWRKMPRPKPVFLSALKLASGERFEVVRTYRMVKSLNDPVTSYIYEKVETRFTSDGPKEGESETYVSEDFINEQGLIVRSTERRSKLTPGNVINSTTMTFEYEPKDIKIQVPAIARGRKR